MKYTESPENPKNAVNIGLYVIIGVCLLVIGGASWFALTNSNTSEPTPKTQSSQKEYSTPSTSYNESVAEPPVISEPTDDSVSSEPYSSEEETSEESESVSDTKYDVTVFSMPVHGEKLKGFSSSELQYSKTYGDMRLHTGIDLKTANGTAVSACADGVVENIELSTTMGNVVTIDHKNGITIKYASLENLEIEIGDSVEAGDIIGTTSTIPAECMDEEHLHIEFYLNNTPQDPLKSLGFEESQED